jgi:hypothetical protein
MGEEDLKLITDGNKKCEDGTFVEMFEGPQWVQIDLGELRDIHAVAIWHYYKNPIVYRDVIVQVADDVEFTQNVRTLFNNDHDNSSELGKGTDEHFFARWWAELIDLRGTDNKGTKARCVRVHTNGNGGSGDKGTCFVEIAVYGTGPGLRPGKELEELKAKGGAEPAAK